MATFELRNSSFNRRATVPAQSAIVLVDGTLIGDGLARAMVKAAEVRQARERQHGYAHKTSYTPRLQAARLVETRQGRNSGGGGCRG